MGLTYLQPYFLAVQLVLQSALLIILLVAAARREGITHVRAYMLRAIGISLACVLLENFLTQKIGWMILVPLTGLTVLVLMNASWTAMWTSCISVALFGAFITFLVLDFGTLSKEEQGARDAAMRKHKVVRAVRYSQVAGEMDKIDVPHHHPAPPPATPAVATNSVAVVTNAPSTLTPNPVTPATALPPPQPFIQFSDTDWIIARSMLSYSGRIRNREGRHVALIGGKFYNQYDVVSVMKKGIMYRWVIMDMQPYSIDLKRLDARGQDPLD